LKGRILLKDKEVFSMVKFEGEWNDKNGFNFF
jgi:hypothetical protein